MQPLLDIEDATAVVAAQPATTHQLTAQEAVAAQASLAKVQTVHVAIPAQAMVHQAVPAKVDPAELVANTENHIQTVRVTDLPAVATMVAAEAEAEPAKAAAGAAKVQSVSFGDRADHIQALVQLINNRITRIITNENICKD
jgi:hypothetical protein